MEPIYLMQLASKQAEWLSVRQATIAQNVANANTPGYMALDVSAFSAALDRTATVTQARTEPGHISANPVDASSFGTGDQQPWEVTNSGNSVGLEQEMMKAGDVNRAYSLNTGIVKAFQNMLLTAVKS